MKRQDVDFTFRVEPETIPIVGNISACGDPVVDRETENWATAQVESGNVYAWCIAVAHAIWTDPDGVTHEAMDTLGGVSCRSRDDFYSRIVPDLEDSVYDRLVDVVRRSASDRPETDHSLGSVQDWINMLSDDGSHVRLRLRFDSTVGMFLLSARIRRYENGEYVKTTIEVGDDRLAVAYERLARKITEGK